LYTTVEVSTAATTTTRRVVFGLQSRESVLLILFFLLFFFPFYLFLYTLAHTVYTHTHTRVYIFSSPFLFLCACDDFWDRYWSECERGVSFMPANANKSLRAADARLSLSLPCAEQYLNLPKVGGGVYLSSTIYTIHT